MKIEVKNVKKMDGHEGLIFSADVFIEGKNVGRVLNDGNGGETDLEFYHMKDSPLRKLCDAAFEWAASLPPKKVGKFEWKMDLNTYIEDLVFAEIERKKNATKWKKGFAFGVVGADNYQFLPLPNGLTFEKILKQQHLPVKHSLQNKINALKLHMKKDEVFLNGEYLISLGFTL